MSPIISNSSPKEDRISFCNQHLKPGAVFREYVPHTSPKKIRFFSNLVEESLVNLQLKIAQIMKAVGFTFNDFDFVINPFQFTGMDWIFTMVQYAIAMAFKHFYKAV